MIKEKCANRKFLCYKVLGKNLIIQTFLNDEKRLLFLKSNKDFQSIDALVIGIPNEVS